MPYGLKRYQHSGQSHFVTFSCYRRRPYLVPSKVSALFLACLEQMRRRYGFRVHGPAGSLLSATLGNGIGETRTYDSRLRLASITAGSVYSLTIPSTGGYAPNNEILAANDSVNGNWVYTYDDFNRLSTAVASNKGLGCSWDYDRYGNRWHQNTYNGSCVTPTASFLGANNRIDGRSYDSAGGLLNDGTHSYTYDAEERISQVDGTPGNCNGASACYVYNAEGQRVRRLLSSGSLDYLYDLAGHPMTEVRVSDGGWNRGEVYAGGRHIATYSGGTTYFTYADWLGTERARTGVNGAQCETVASLPFGDNQITSGSCGDPSPLHFTGKERDTESNLDNFEARYFGSTYGRFMTPDWAARPTAVPYAVFGDPQSLNLYGYVRNDPVSRADADGHMSTCGYTGAWCVSSEAENAAAQQNTKKQSPPPAQNQNPEQPQGENQPNQPNQPQQPEAPKPPPSWDPKQPLPEDPTKLGPDWKRDPGHKAPNDERWVNDKGDKLDWHRGKPGEKGWKGKDHWHWNEHDWHFKPGDTVKNVATAIAVGVVVYWVVSEASRLFPPRNLVPVP